MRFVVELSEFDIQNIYSNFGVQISVERAKQLLKSRTLKTHLKPEIQNIIEFHIVDNQDPNPDTATDELSAFIARDGDNET